MYRSTQAGRIINGLILLVALWTLWAVSRLAWHPGLLALVGLFLVLAFLFRSLSVEVDAQALRCWFGGGLIRHRIPLAQIESAEVVRNRWYYGWGIRWLPGGWMFNIEGLDAVELRLASGKRFRVGTDQPQELVAAIERQMALAG